MATTDPKVEKRESMVRMQTSLGKISKKAMYKLQEMTLKERMTFMQRLTAYVLKHELEGGPLTNQVIDHTKETMNELLGGMDIPEVKSE